LEKQVAELQQKSKDNEYALRGRVQARGDEMERLVDRVNSMELTVKKLISGLKTTTNQQDLNVVNLKMTSGMAWVIRAS
jgi:hypothetical protein